jgi:hypothetical protein
MRLVLFETKSGVYSSVPFMHKIFVFEIAFVLKISTYQYDMFEKTKILWFYCKKSDALVGRV